MTIRTCLVNQDTFYDNQDIFSKSRHTPLPNLLELDLEVSVMLADSCDKRGDGDV